MNILNGRPLQLFWVTIWLHWGLPFHCRWIGASASSFPDIWLITLKFASSLSLNWASVFSLPDVRLITVKLVFSFFIQLGIQFHPSERLVDHNEYMHLSFFTSYGRPLAKYWVADNSLVDIKLFLHDIGHLISTYRTSHSPQWMQPCLMQWSDHSVTTLWWTDCVI